MQSPSMLRVGIVEDDPVLGSSLVQRFDLEGYGPELWSTGAKALQSLQRTPPDVLICDIRLPDMSGEELFKQALPRLGRTPVIFMTAYGEVAQAVRLLQAGADDYLTKPFQLGSLLDRVRDLVQARQSTATGEMGPSEAMRSVESLLRRVADLDSTILITGETGVGKEVAAAFVHAVSDRRELPFMAVNCAAIPPDLIDSELFGHERGAFTGAHSRHFGYAERAGSGVLFLDEIAELPTPVQAKLLRLLQERQFFRIGGEKAIDFKGRLICSTNANLPERVAAGTFREDLYYRVNVIPVPVPPLRERREDIAYLLEQFADHFTAAFDRDLRGVSSTAAAAAEAYDWPGNVRELRNRIERATALTLGPWIGPHDLFPESCHTQNDGDEVVPLAAARDAAERAHILSALRRTDGRLAEAARLLAVSRTTLWEKMRRLRIDPSAAADRSES